MKNMRQHSFEGGKNNVDSRRRSSFEKKKIVKTEIEVANDHVK